jgi:hypothetical protein
MLLGVLLVVAGAFSFALGTLHFFLPTLLDYRSVVLDHAPDWKPRRPFRVWLTRYTVTLRDRYGIVWVMNHTASYALVLIGLVDLLAVDWLRGTPVGHLAALAIAGFWLLRAGTQLTLGRRSGDWLILAWFAALGLLHLFLAIG